MSCRSAARSSRIGAIVRHGPHHDAQKSTIVAFPSPIVRWNVASVSVTGWLVSGVLHFPQIAVLPDSSAGRRLACPHEGQRITSLTMTASAKRVPTRADLPAIIALVERANETPYDIARVAEEKV